MSAFSNRSSTTLIYSIILHVENKKPSEQELTVT